MRRTPFFYPRRHAKGREEHLAVRGGRGGTRRTPFLIHEGPLRGAKNTFLSAEDAENTFFIRECTRRGAKNILLSAEDAKGRGER